MNTSWKTWVTVTALAFLTWAYFPPIGTEVELPQLLPFLDPGVPHAAPAFIETADHIYYRVRLHRAVEPWFAWTYYQRLHMRGVQIAEVTSSPHLPLQRRSGWEMAMSREKALEPYSVEYWRSEDSSGRFFVSLRWPWLYVRLGKGVRRAHTITIPPPASGQRFSALVREYPGSRLVSANVQLHAVHCELWAPGSGADILLYYATMLGARDDLALAKNLQAHNYSFSLTPPEPPARDWLNPEAVTVEVDNYLYVDHPFMLFPWDQAARGPEYQQQSDLLTHLPKVSHYRLSFHYGSPAVAQGALKTLVLPPPESST